MKGSKMDRYFRVILTGLTLLAPLTFAHASKVADPLALQKQMFDQSRDLARQAFDTKAGELDIRIERRLAAAVDEVGKKHVEALTRLEETNATFKGFIAIAILLMGVVFTYWIHTLRSIRTTVEQRLSQHLNVEIEKLRRTMTVVDLEEGFRRERRLLVVGRDASSADMIAGWLRALDFRKVEVAIRQLTDGAQADLLIFDGGLGEAKIARQMEACAPNDVFVVYTEEQLKFDSEARKRLNMANSPLTLYPNVVNTLKHKELLARRTE